MERIWFIKDVPLFERLTNSEIRPIEYRSRARSFPQGSPIQLPEEPVVFLLTEGQIRTEVAYWDDQSAVSPWWREGRRWRSTPG